MDDGNNNNGHHQGFDECGIYDLDTTVRETIRDHGMGFLIRRMEHMMTTSDMQTRNRRTEVDSQSREENLPGFIRYTAPRCPEMATYEARIQTYRTWPRSLAQKPEDLAEAGFYYTGESDKVNCFHCNIGLWSWEQTDTPWGEHARNASQCPFVRIKKGDDFIQSFQVDVEQYVTEINKRTLLQSTSNKSSDNGSAGASSEGSSQPSPSTSRSNNSSSLSPNKISLTLRKSSASSIGSMDLLEVPRMRSKRLSSEGSLSLSSMSSASSSEESSEEPLTDINRQTQNLQAGSDSSEDLEHMNQSLHNMEMENNLLRQQRSCKVCMDADVAILFLPCGHLVCCENCAPSLKTCAVCRVTITGCLRAYMA